MSVYNLTAQTICHISSKEIMFKLQQIIIDTETKEGNFAEVSMRATLSISDLWRVPNLKLCQRI
jgi:hypothetical protein